MGTVVFYRYSRMLRMLVLACVVASSLAFMAPKSAVKSYAYLTIMKNCYGEEVLKGYMTKYKDAVAMCSGKPTSISDMPAVRQYLMQLRSAASRPNYIPIPIPMFGRQGDLSSLFRQGDLPNPFQQDTMIENPFSSREKRSVDLSPEKLEMMKEQMLSKVSNMTCMFQEMGYMKEDKTPDYDYCMEETANLEIDNELKADLIEDMSMCRDFAKCMPLDAIKSPIQKECGEFMAFMKCCKAREMVACMKKDFRQGAAAAGYEAPDDEMIMFSMIKGVMGDMGEMMDM